MSNQADAGAGTLRQAIDNASNGDVILLGENLKDQIIVLNSTLVINKDIAILSQVPVTVSGHNQVRVFEIQNGNVLIEGTVTSLPPIIQCGSTCQTTLSHGSQLTLTAVASSTANFSGWSGACSGTSSCMLQLDGTKLVTATFSLRASQENQLYLPLIQRNLLV